MRTGRPATPTEIKRKRGTARADRGVVPESQAIALRSAAIAPDPPDDLNPECGGSYWVTVWGSGAKEWLAVETDTPTLHAACKLLDEINEMRAIIDERGLVQEEPIATPSGAVVGTKLVANPVLKLKLAAEGQLEKHLSNLGFSPAARAKLGYAEVKRQSGLEELMARRSARQDAA